ncbi:IclR family transcriptional regulator [Jatrophihabitans fulvus]
MPEIAQTADHALRILEELGRGAPLTAAQLGERLALNRTVTHRLLTTLAARGFVLRRDGAYRPGPTLARLAGTPEPDLRAVARPVMAQLAGTVGETVTLHVLDGGQAVVLDQVVADGHVVRVSERVGARHGLDVSASGRVVLAFLPPAVADAIVRRASSPDRLERTLRAVRRRRYDTSRDELQNGVHGLAVPILGPGGSALASLAVLVPSSRARSLPGARDALWQAAERIGTRLGPG